MKRMGFLCCGLLTMVLLGVPFLCAQQPISPASSLTPRASAPSPEIPQAVTDKLKELDQRVAAAQSPADNAWMLVSENRGGHHDAELRADGPDQRSVGSRRL